MGRDLAEGGASSILGSQKQIGPVAFFVRRKATHRRSGETSFNSFGPFPTYEQAQANQREDQAARSESEYDYDYDYRIERVSAASL